MADNTVKLKVDTSGEGEPVLLLHGFPDSRKMWHLITPFFKDKNYRVIAPDMRGFGDSPMPIGKNNYKYNLVIADIVELLKEQNIQQPINVIGHDWGAVIGWCFALEHPALVKKLVAVSVGHPKAYARAGWQQKWKGLYVAGFQFAGIAEYFLSKNNFSGLRKWGKQHPFIAECVADMSRSDRLTAGLNYYRANFIDIFTDWSNCKVPVLGIWSTNDSLLAEDQMTDSEKYMDADWEYVQLENVGHWIPLEQPQQLFRLADEWFSNTAL